jgi:fumarate reductase subunit C
MAQPAHPHAMAPPRPGRTRTAPPMKPGNWPSSSRYRTYLAFDFTGLVYLLAGFAVLYAVRQLAAGPEAWSALLARFASPLWLVFHALVLVSAVFVGVRFFRLFPKAQPPRIGPAKPPPRPLLHAMLYAAWIGATLVLVVVLGGIFP